MSWSRSGCRAGFRGSEPASLALSRERPVEHEDPEQAPVIGALDDVEPLENMLTLGIDDFPGIPHDLIERIDTARRYDLRPRSQRVVATDPFAEAVHTSPSARRVHELRLVGYRPSQQAAALLVIGFIPCREVVR